MHKEGKERKKRRGISRREFVELLLTIPFVGVAVRFLDNFHSNERLPLEEIERLIELAARFPKQILGIYPNLDNVIRWYTRGNPLPPEFRHIDGLARDMRLPAFEQIQPELDKQLVIVEYFQKLLGEQFHSIGLFLNFTEMQYPVVWERKKELYEYIFEFARKRGIKVVLSVSTGSVRGKVNGPSFYPLSEAFQPWLFNRFEEILRWVAPYHELIEWRPLYEANIPDGDIAIKTQSFWGGVDEEKKEWYLKIFEMFVQSIRRHYPDAEIHQALSPLGDSTGYFTDRRDVQVGHDVYHTIDKKEELTLSNLIIGKAGVGNLSEKALRELREQSATHTTNIYEIGSKIQDIDWLEQFILRFLAQGGHGVWLFLIEKLQTEGIDWRLVQEKIARIVWIYLAIDAEREKLHKSGRLRHAR